MVVAPPDSPRRPIERMLAPAPGVVRLPRQHRQQQQRAMDRANISGSVGRSVDWRGACPSGDSWPAGRAYQHLLGAAPVRPLWPFSSATAAATHCRQGSVCTVYDLPAIGWPPGHTEAARPLRSLLAQANRTARCVLREPTSGQDGQSALGDGPDACLLGTAPHSRGRLRRQHQQA